MRIIAGDYKGRRLNAPFGVNIRPTTDKVKEAIFSMIAPHIPEAVCADVFAGTGNLGLEALSRGAERCYFSDQSRESIVLVKENVKRCGAEDKTIIYSGDFQRALDKIKEKVDIFFLDPPYKKGLILQCIEKIEEYELLADDGIIVAEHGIDEVLPEEACGLIKLKEKKYGKIVITIYG